MKTLILYHPNSQHARSVEEFAHDYQRFGHGPINLISLEDRQGSDMARLYDIVSYPAVIALRDTGEVLASWQGEQLPLMNEVASYT